MTFTRFIKAVKLLICATTAMLSLASCGDDDDENVILHRRHLEGIYNDDSIAVDRINDAATDGTYWLQFTDKENSDLPKSVELHVPLSEKNDSDITLYLNLYDIYRLNETITHKDENFRTKDSTEVYIEVDDKKAHTLTYYWPSPSNPFHVTWKNFMISVDSHLKHLQKNYNSIKGVKGQRWPGIEGQLDGKFTCDDPSKSPLKVNMKFALY